MKNYKFIILMILTVLYKIKVNQNMNIDKIIFLDVTILNTKGKTYKIKKNYRTII